MVKIKSKSMLCVMMAVVMLIGCFALMTACAPSTTQVANLTQLLEAISGNADKIILTEDIDVGGDSIVVGRKVTIDLNGKTLSNSADIWDIATKDWSIISVRENGDLTITGKGKVQSKENDCYAVDVQQGGKLTVENGEFVGNVHALYAKEGEIYVNGGTYSIQQLFAAGKEREYVLNCYDEDYKNGTAKISVTGGTFVGFNPQNCYAEGENTNFVAQGYKAELIQGTTNYKVVKA